MSSTRSAVARGVDGHRVDASQRGLRRRRQSSALRRASRTTRIASTPAAMAAAIGSRECSGPGGRDDGVARSWRRSTSPVRQSPWRRCWPAASRWCRAAARARAAGRAVGGRRLLGRCLLRRRAFLAALAGAFFAGAFLAGAFLAAFSAAAFFAGRRRARLRCRIRRRRLFGGLRRPVDPAGLPSGCSFAVLVQARSACGVGPGSAPIMPVGFWSLSRDRQCGGQGQRHGHARQLDPRPQSRHVGGGAV